MTLAMGVRLTGGALGSDLGLGGRGRGVWGEKRRGGRIWTDGGGAGVEENLRAKAERLARA